MRMTARGVTVESPGTSEEALALVCQLNVPRPTFVSLGVGLAREELRDFAELSAPRALER